ncbi:MAG TPA: hypothetical protein VFW07_12935 [Parafilimonas sp.]|nr:hypothetical protein [Parafilimonas sp.]
MPTEKMLLNSLIKQNLAFLHLVCMLLISGIAIKAQDTLHEKLIAGGKLQWSDYTGEVDKHSAYWATTFWYVHYKYKIIQAHGDTVKIDLQVWPALQEKSWVLPDKKSPELLQHEQGHFDLARLLTAEFKKEAGSTALLMNNYSRKLDSIFNAALTNIKQMEIQYDKETNHMWNRDAQERWNKKIADMLEAVE